MISQVEVGQSVAADDDKRFIEILARDWRRCRPSLKACPRRRSGCSRHSRCRRHSNPRWSAMYCNVMITSVIPCLAEQRQDMAQDALVHQRQHRFRAPDSQRAQAGSRASAITTAFMWRSSKPGHLRLRLVIWRPGPRAPGRRRSRPAWPARSAPGRRRVAAK